MKKKITTIWSVGLTLVLATTMLLFPMPASAGTLSWSSETIPSTSGNRLVTGTDPNVLDLAVSAGGDIIYSVNGTDVMYRSTNGGETWSSIVIDDELRATKVVVAQDDENYIAVAGNATLATSTVYISDDAGANWDSLGVIAIGATSPDINDLAISVAKSGNHYIAVATENSTSASVWYFKIGAVGAVWTDASLEDGFTASQNITGAVAFSPNFASDETMVAVSANTTGGSSTTTNAIVLQIYHFDKSKWNSNAGFNLYPVEIVGATGDAVVDGLDSASISLSPDYLGSDDDMRLSFVGITTVGGATADDADGIFRLDEDSVKALKEDKNIHSVAYDGTNLIAGRFDTTGVYRSADPLASSPSVSGSASLKSPGGTGSTVVAWSGATAVAGTSGDESAFAVSENDGKTFNDISLIDTTLTVLSDVAVSADGSNIYLATADEVDGDMSLWRYASRWERVLTIQNPTTADLSDVIVRTAPYFSSLFGLCISPQTNTRP